MQDIHEGTSYPQFSETGTRKFKGIVLGVMGYATSLPRLESRLRTAFGYHGPFTGSIDPDGMCTVTIQDRNGHALIIGGILGWRTRKGPYRGRLCPAPQHDQLNAQGRADLIREVGVHSNTYFDLYDALVQVHGWPPADEWEEEDDPCVIPRHPASNGFVRMIVIDETALEDDDTLTVEFTLGSAIGGYNKKKQRRQMSERDWRGGCWE